MHLGRFALPHPLTSWRAVIHSSNDYSGYHSMYHCIRSPTSGLHTQHRGPPSVSRSYLPHRDTHSDTLLLWRIKMQARVLCLSFPVLSGRDGLGPYKIGSLVSPLNRIGGLSALGARPCFVHALSVGRPHTNPGGRDFLLTGYPLYVTQCIRVERNGPFRE